MKRVALIASLIMWACCGDGYDPGPAPDGFEGLWEQAIDGAEGARKSVELVKQGVIQSCSGGPPANATHFLAGYPYYECLEISGNYDGLLSLPTSYWGSGYTMHSSTGGHNVVYAAAQSSSGRFAMLRFFGETYYDTTGGYQQVCAKNGWGVGTGTNFAPKSLYHIEDAIGGGAPVDPCTGY